VFKKIAKFLLTVISAFVLGILVSQNTVSRVTVSGHSMDYTLEDGQKLWVNRLPWVSYERGDVVIAHENGTPIVKRVIGIAGDRVQFIGDDLYVNDKLVQEPYVTDVDYDKGILKDVVTLGEDEFILLGDNRDVSNDSRYFGAVKDSSIKGKVFGYGSKVR
jgi:signal peptidase I